MLTPLARSVISRTRPLNRSRAFGAIARLILRPAVKLKPRNFRSYGRATALFAAFTFLHDEQRYVLHHPLTRPLAANVDITKSAYRTKRCPRRSNSPSSASSASLLSSGFSLADPQAAHGNPSELRLWPGGFA